MTHFTFPSIGLNTNWPWSAKSKYIPFNRLLEGWWRTDASAAACLYSDAGVYFGHYSGWDVKNTYNSHCPPKESTPFALNPKNLDVKLQTWGSFGTWRFGGRAYGFWMHVVHFFRFPDGNNMCAELSTKSCLDPGLWFYENPCETFNMGLLGKWWFSGENVISGLVGTVISGSQLRTYVPVIIYQMVSAYGDFNLRKSMWNTQWWHAGGRGCLT